MKKSNKKKLQGIVKSTKMDKTIIVLVDMQKKHHLYFKSYRVTKKYYVHDEKNKAKKGDRVVICEYKPISKNKKWKLIEIIKDK